MSWNLNGIRAAQKQGLAASLLKMKADVFCFQEIKARQDQLELGHTGYHAYWNSAEKPGYSGTLTLTKIKPLKVEHGLPGADDKEGRVQTIEFESYYLVNVYTPNSKRDLSRLSYRQEIWDALFLKHLKKLEKKKPVVFCGDLNCAHTELDLANPKSNRKNAGFTAEERSGFDNYINAGFLDTFRMFESASGHYTWWTFRSDARARNIGWRIDYFCVSKSLQSKVVKSEILGDVFGSDHCPVRMTLTLN